MPLRTTTMATITAMKRAVYTITTVAANKMEEQTSSHLLRVHHRFHHRHHFLHLGGTFVPLRKIWSVLLSGQDCHHTESVREAHCQVSARVEQRRHCCYHCQKYRRRRRRRRRNNRMRSATRESRSEPSPSGCTHRRSGSVCRGMVSCAHSIPTRAGHFGHSRSMAPV